MFSASTLFPTKRMCVILPGTPNYRLSRSYATEHQVESLVQVSSGAGPANYTCPALQVSFSGQAPTTKQTAASRLVLASARRTMPSLADASRGNIPRIP